MTTERMKNYLIVFVFAALFSNWTGHPVHAEEIASSPSVYAISDKDFKASLAGINELMSSGEWAEAKTSYLTLLQHDLSVEDRKNVQKSLEALNMKILFSPVQTKNSTSHIVQAGDALYKIAKRYGTTVELIKKSNHLTSDLIRPGMELKVSKAKYEIVVDKSDNQLKLISDGEVLKTYAVATGKDNGTPIGTFTIESKLIHPVWYTAGAVVPPDSPENILGTRWLGFSLEGYGIHGTTLPETIGTQSTKGCVRMHNHDVEELYSIAPLKTTVTVVD